MTETWAVIPTRGRPDIFRHTVESILPQVDGLVVIDNNDEPTIMHTWIADLDNVVVLHVVEQPPNLSRMLNLGIDWIRRQHPDRQVNIALLNDDVTVPPSWVRALVAVLRNTPAAAVYSSPMRVDIMSCWACIFKGERAVLRWDEDLRWWYGDNAFTLLCRQHGGTFFVPDAPAAVHHHPDAQTYSSPMLSQMAHEDAATYHRKYEGV